MLTDHRFLAAGILGALTVATVTGVFVLLRQWSTGRVDLDRRQVPLRVAAGVVILAIWFLIGVLLLEVDPSKEPRLFANCLGSTVLLTLTLPGFVLLDFRWVVLRRLREQHERTRELGQLLSGTTREPGGADES